jgi:predicted metal-dependent hydrolase
MNHQGGINRLRGMNQPLLPFGAAPTTSPPFQGWRVGTVQKPQPHVSGAGGLVFVRHRRAKRYILRVADDGTVRITIPRGGSRREAEAFAKRERAWIGTELERVARRRIPTPDRLSAERESELRRKAARELPERLFELAAQWGLTVSRVSVRNQRRRWGSCSGTGHVCLNWRLIRMPPWIRDYVLIHELMHLKRMDHSPAFWALVAKACPAYLEARAWLRSSGESQLS